MRPSCRMKFERLDAAIERLEAEGGDPTAVELLKASMEEVQELRAEVAELRRQLDLIMARDL